MDQQLCFLGNADAGCVISAVVRRRRARGDDRYEFVDVVLSDLRSMRRLAVYTLQMLAPCPAGGTA